MAFLANQEEEEENLPPITDDTFFENAKSSSIKISLKAQMGDIKTPTFCVRFDHNDKYIAAARGDGSISIFNVLTHKQSYSLNEGMEEPMPTTIVRWRPICAPGVTKNVLIATNAKGHISHYHTTSGKLLNRIFDEVNQLLSCDYKPDGYSFVTAGTDTVVRVYDEQTRQLKQELTGGVNGEPGHSNRIFCVKYYAEDPNLIVSGGWDKCVKIWDTRTPDPVRSIQGPYICGDAIDIQEGLILTGSHTMQEQLKLWDFGSGELVEQIQYTAALNAEKDCTLYAAQLEKTQGSILIAGGSGANELKVFDGDASFNPCSRVYNCSRAVYTADFNQAGDVFAMGGGDGVVRVFNIIKGMD